MNNLHPLQAEPEAQRHRTSKWYCIKTTRRREVGLLRGQKLNDEDMEAVVRLGELSESEDTQITSAGLAHLKNQGC